MKLKILLFLIVILGFLLRGWNVAKFPTTLYGDEQAFAWNAYNILKLGQDEYGNPYPLQFRSFDDYKAPIPVYLLVPFIKIFGLNAFAIRIPIVIVSTLTIIAVYFLARLFFNKKTSLIITFLLSISPWHIHLSRGFFESTLALFWFILGVYFLLKGDNHLKEIILGMFFFALTIYSYFTPRILVPIFLVFLFFFRRFIDKLKTGKNYLLGIIFLSIISLPLLYLTFAGPSFSRFTKLSESAQMQVTQTVNAERYATNIMPPWSNLLHNKIIVRLRMIKNNYLEHLSPNFWYIYGDSSLRYFTGNMGMFYLLEFPFFILGFYCLWTEKRKTAILSLGWILLAPIPASLVGKPFAVRSLAMLPTPFLIGGYGLYKVTSLFSAKRIKGLTAILISVLFAFSLGSLLVRYYLEYPVYAATWWGWENKAALDYAKARESGYDNIFISDFYTGATLAFAVYNQYDPLIYRYAVNNPVTLADNRHLIKLGKYYFGSLDINRERLSGNIISPKSLYIGRPEEADSSETVNAPDDGRVIFKIYKTN